MVISRSPNERRANSIYLGIILILGVSFVSLVANYEAWGAEWWTDANIYNPSVKEWTPYVLFEDGGSIQVRTSQGSFVYDKNLCEIAFFNGKSLRSPVIGSDSYQVYQMVDGTGIWNPVDVINNATCETTLNADGKNIEIIGTKQVAGVGEFKIHYIKNKHEDLKTLLEATNFSLLTDRRFKVVQTIQVPQLINFGGSQRDLQQLDGMVFDRQFMIDNKANVIDLFNRVDFDLTQGFANFDTLTLQWNTLQGKAYMIIDYAFNAPLLLPNETLFIDPSFGWSSGQEYRISETAVADTSCTGTASTNDTVSQMRLFPSATNAGCRFPAFSWTGLATAFNSDVTIDSAVVEVTTVATTSNARDCEFRAMTNQPNIAPAQDVLDDIKDGSIFASGISGCTGISTFNVTLNTAGESDLESTLNAGSDWWAVGSPYENLVRDGLDRTTTFSTPRLWVLYTNGTNPEFRIDIITNTTIGDVTRIEATVEPTRGEFNQNFTSFQILLDDSIVRTNTTVFNATVGEPVITYGDFWIQIDNTANHNITATATITNSTGTQTNSTMVWSNQEYDPNYDDASDLTLGDVNYTIQRVDSDTDVWLKVNREGAGEEWDINCVFQDLQNAFIIQNTTVGTWSNTTDTGYFNTTYSTNTGETVYITCYNPPNVLFATTSYGNSTFLQAGIAIFDGLGGFFGAPAVIIVVLAVFSLATSTNSPSIILLGGAVLGILGAFNVLVFSQPFWGAIMVLTALGLFAIRKFF